MALRRGAVTAALLGAIVLGGSALRFYGLDAQSLWNDELSSWKQSHQTTISAVIENGVRPTPYPPAYPVLLYFVERYVGESEIALRSSSAVAGVLAIIATFFLARQLYSVREGIIAAGLMAFSYQPVYYSQEARAYSLLLLFSILSSHFWFRLRGQLEARDRISGSTAAAYIACAVATQSCITSDCFSSSSSSARSVDCLRCARMRSRGSSRSQPPYLPHMCRGSGI